MLDFYDIHDRPGGTKADPVIEVYPRFKVGQISDLMTRGHAFYAVWDPDVNLWSTNEFRVCELVDEDLFGYLHKIQAAECRYTVKQMGDYDSGKWAEFQRYTKNMPDNVHELDKNIIFADMEVTRGDYASHKLPYSLTDGESNAWNELVGTLYSKQEREKIEWAIGAILTGDSKKLQKFLVFYGEGGSGKSTILNVIQQLFEGYWIPFNAKELASKNNSFALSILADNPLLAIQHDGDLSRIEDNTLLNSIVSHETMSVNEKFKSPYNIRPVTFLMMATNKPVKITDAKSGLIRRLIDVHPSGNKIPPNRYTALMSQIPFELGAIARHCIEVYNSLGFHHYDGYKALTMLEKTDVFYNFMEENYFVFKEHDGIPLKTAWEMYKNYSTDSHDQYMLPKFKFRDELKNYFRTFVHDTVRDGVRVTNFFDGFKTDRFFSNMTDSDGGVTTESHIGDAPEWLQLDDGQGDQSIFDMALANQPAQYANERGTPQIKWDDVKTTLKEIDTSQLHYVKMPEKYICIDFDLKGDDGEKSLERNIAAASNWPATYAETSKSGKALHLIYIYDGDVNKLSHLYAEDIEIKTFPGNSSLRRKLTLRNALAIATISSGLPLEEVKAVVDFDGIKSEKQIRTMIKKNLNREYHADTSSSIDFIFKVLDDAYNSGVKYDVRDMRTSVMKFAMNSTNQSQKCMAKFKKMHFCSKDYDEIDNQTDISQTEKEESQIVVVNGYASDEFVFFDVEVFPNLFVVVWKTQNTDCVRWINPSSAQIEELLRYKLIGFNNRKYDNHILYGRLIGYSNQELYDLSQRIISGNRSAFFGWAYNLSWTDIYDFSSKKQSLKKFEIELGIHHQELGLPWDKPVPEELWDTVADYCCNDVIATQATFEARHGDYVAREMLAAITGMTVNSTTNALTAKLIFDGEKHPQTQFVYTDLSKFFPGYEFKNGKSYYRGEEVGEGGYVYAEPGMYEHATTEDVASMHPSSIIALNLFGDTYTQKFKELVQARIAIKHGDYETAGKMFDGKLRPYLNNKDDAKALAKALKIAINSVYGLTAAKFDNPFRDKRNVDNIVAKRGALFMIDLRHEVQDRGYTVIHVKTDSIKIKDADQKILDFVVEYGKKWGYNFEIEHTWKRLCLVNNAVFIGKHGDDDPESPNEWEATGTQFQVPYVYKKLFTHEKITLDDMCETKSCQTALYLDMNENLAEGEHNYQFVGKTGQFCPMKPGVGGGLLIRTKSDDQYKKQIDAWKESNDPKKPKPGLYASVGGTIGYRWMESEVVRKLGLQDSVDESYYKAKVDEAIDDISKYGDFEWFVA